ncbi:hypothetical protein Tco_0860465 [Tanacetum coccineum]|uniref:Uncharacterized protein n=1 Tax=Tanacetum coccineum TaxID=301880 RepID=A0ABQ5BHZ3_9ASTR
MVIRQRIEDFQLGIKSYQTKLNLTKPRWDATGLKFKHDFTIIDSPRAVTFRDKYGVKEFKVNRMNPGLDTWFWTRKDVERSKEFMFAIQKRLKTRWIFRNLESFVGGRKPGSPTYAVRITWLIADIEGQAIMDPEIQYISIGSLHSELDDIKRLAVAPA